MVGAPQRVESRIRLYYKVHEKVQRVNSDSGGNSVYCHCLHASVIIVLPTRSRSIPDAVPKEIGTLPPTVFSCGRPTVISSHSPYPNVS